MTCSHTSLYLFSAVVGQVCNRGERSEMAKKREERVIPYVFHLIRTLFFQLN